MVEGTGQWTTDDGRSADRAWMGRTAHWTAVLVVGLALSGCADSVNNDCVDGPAATIEAATFAGSLQIDLSAMTRLVDGLYIQDLTVGAGEEAMIGSLLRMTYAGWYPTGQQFDSGQNFNFELGSPNIIDGWTLGVEGMRVGGTRKMVVAPGLGYGPCRFNLIPGNSILVFEVTLDQVG